MTSEFGEQLIRLRSFEEALTLAGALIIAAIFYKLAGRFFGAPALTSVVIGLLTAATLAYATWSELTLHSDMITHRNRFRERSFPISHVETVGFKTFWGGLPGQTFMFLMRRPPAELDGYFGRVGLFAWPSTSQWANAVNLAARSAR